MNSAHQHHRTVSRAVTLALGVGFAAAGIAGSASADTAAATGSGECPSSGSYGDTCVTAPEIPVVDECGPGNAHYGEVPWGPWEAVLNDDGSVTITAMPGYEFPDDETVITYPAPTDSNLPCPVVTPPPPPPPPVVTPPVVVPPVVVPEVLPAQVKVVRAAARQIDKCGRMGDLFRVGKRSGVVYRANGKVLRQGVWIKATTRTVTVRARSTSATYELRGTRVWRMTFSARPCAPVPEVAPDTGA